MSIFQAAQTPINPYPCKLLPYPAFTILCLLCNAFQRIPQRSGSRLEAVSLQFTGIFILNTYLFLLMVSPETIYLYVVYVDLEMIENQCPLRLTCNHSGISDLNFARSKNTRFKSFNFKEFMQTKKLSKESFVQN